MRHVHVLISQVLQHALEDGLIRCNPAKRASPPTKLEAASPETMTSAGFVVPLRAART